MTARPPSDALFRELADAMPQLVWTATPAGFADFANKAMVDYVGLARDDAGAIENWYTAIHPDETEQALREWWHAVKTMDIATIECRLRRAADGEYRWMLLRAELARDASGTMSKWYGTAIDIHDRRCAEEEAAELAQRLTSTLESITDAFVALDRDWHVIYFNAAAEKLLSQPRDDALGKVVWDLFPSSVNTAFHREYHRARAQNTPVEFEEYSALTGKWFGVRAYPSEQGLSIYFRDVTRERVVRETLRRSEERFEFVARATTDAVWDWDLTTDARWWNEGMQTLFGVPREAVEPHIGSWTGRIHPLDLPRVHDSIDAFARDAGADHWEAEYRFRRHDGSYALVQDRAFAIRDASGMAVRMVGGMTDLTARRKAEDEARRAAEMLALEMRKSEEKYRLLFDSNPHAMWVYDPETLRFLAVNQAAVKRYGYSVDEFLAMTARDIWSTANDPETAAAMEAHLRSVPLQGKLEGQRRHRTRDGSTVDAETSGDDIVFDGKPARLVHVLDVTERLKAEREVQRLARAQRMLSACNESLIRATREADLLGRICRIAVDVGGYRVAWVGFAHNDADSSVERVAYAGENENAVLTVPSSWSESNPGGRGTVGRALRSGRIEVVEDAALQPHSEEWAQLVEAHHIKGVVSLPLRDGAHTFGVLCLYAPDALHFSAPELALMEEMANDLAFGITNLRKLEEQKRLQQAVLKAASYDALTGLPNRQLFSEALLRAARASAGSPGHCAVLLVNLDNFKVLNKTLGLTNGDRLLQLVAQRIKSRVGAADTTARLGGDEFLILQEGLGPDAESASRQAAASARRLLDALEQPFGLGDFEHATTACVGVTVFKGLEPGVGDLLNQADLALDHAKAIGRNSVRFFDPGMQLAIAERAALEADLGLALAQHEMELHFQPQADGDGRLRGVEALLRWRHPQRGMVSPATFIPLAEESGLILAIGQWVVESACAVLKTWQDQPRMAGLTMAVNVSASQFRHPDFVEQVAGAVRRSGIEPKQLKLELTESILVYDMKAIIEKMYALRSLGVGFSLDDFGTGYSSLSYLKQMPLDQLKIDQSFVREVMTNAKDAAIAKTVIALAHSLELHVIAEGVELQAQRDFLLQNGCDAYQGYLLSRPLPLVQLEAFVARYG